MLIRPMLTIQRRRIRRLVLTMIRTRTIPLIVLPAIALMRMLALIATRITRALRLILRDIKIRRIRSSNSTLLIYYISRVLRFLKHTRTEKQDRRITRVVTRTTMMQILLSDRSLRTIVSHLLRPKRSVLTRLVVYTCPLNVLDRARIALVSRRQLRVQARTLRAPRMLLL